MRGYVDEVASYLRSSTIETSDESRIWWSAWQRPSYLDLMDEVWAQVDPKLKREEA